LPDYLWNAVGQGRYITLLKNSSKQTNNIFLYLPSPLAFNRLGFEWKITNDNVFASVWW